MCAFENKCVLFEICCVMLYDMVDVWFSFNRMCVSVCVRVFCDLKCDAVWCVCLWFVCGLCV